jgi:hypothetical protein
MTPAERGPVSETPRAVRSLEAQHPASLEEEALPMIRTVRAFTTDAMKAHAHESERV